MIVEATRPERIGAVRGMSDDGRCREIRIARKKWRWEGFDPRILPASAFAEDPEYLLCCEMCGARRWAASPEGAGWCVEGQRRAWTELIAAERAGRSRSE